MKMRRGTSTRQPKQADRIPLEEIIQAQIVQYLQSLRIFRHSVPNEAAGTNAVKTMQLISMGLWAGAGDLIVWWPLVADWYEYPEDPASVLPTYPVQLGYVEVKRPGIGVQSPKQQSFERRCNRHSVHYMLAYGVDDIKAELERRGLAVMLPRSFLPN